MPPVAMLYAPGLNPAKRGWSGTLLIEQSSAPEPTHDWRVLVPGKLNLTATSVLEEEIFNPEIEAQWRAHLQELSDDELRAVTPRQAYGGLFDRLERVTRAYEDEMARRGLKPESR